MKDEAAPLTFPPSRRLLALLILGSLSAFGPLSIDMYLPALPRLADDLQTTTSLAQFSLTACLLGLSTGQLVAGPLSDVRGRKKPLIIGLILYAAVSVLCALAPSAWALILLRYMQGAAGSAGIVISRAIARDLYSGTALTKFSAMLMLVNGTAPILAPIIGGQLLLITSWRGIFFVLSLIGVLMFAAVLFSLPETLPPERRSEGGIRNKLASFRKLCSDRAFMGIALSQGLVTAAMFAYISGSPFVLQNVYGASEQLFSLFFGINGLGIIIASQLTGRLAGRLGERRLFVTGIIITAIGSVVLLTMILAKGSLIAILVPLFFVVSSVGVVNTAGFTLAMGGQKRNAGSAAALLGLLSFIFGGVTAPLVGIGGSHNAIPMGIIIVAAGVGSILCYILLVKREKQIPQTISH